MGDAGKVRIKYNILYIDSSQGIFGGGQISLLELLSRINRVKFHPFVILAEEGELKRRIEQLKIEYRIIPMPSIRFLNIFTFMNALWGLASFMVKKQIYLVHTNTSRATIYAGSVAKILNIPLIWHVRIPYSDGLLDRVLAYFSTLIITVSQAVKKRFEWLKKGKVEVVYNGVDVEKFSQESIPEDAREKFRINSEDIVIGAVGRLSSEKGFEFLISAMEEVVKVYPKTKALIVGDGNEKYRLSLQAQIDELKLSSRIIFTGFCEDIFQVLKCMNIFCLPSLTEGFNRSILEAMASGLPVIATSVGGNIEIVENGVNGLLVPPCNSKALASSITELLKDKEKAKRMGQAGSKLVRERFSIDRNVKQIEELYENILN